MAPRKKQLTLEHINNEDLEYGKLQRVTFDNGTYTEIHSKFRPSLIEALLVDFSLFVSQFESTGKSIKEKDMPQYIVLHAILYFSTLIENIPSTLPEKIDLFNKMIDSKYAKKIAESFDPNELIKITEAIYEKLNNLVILLEKEKEMKSKVMEQMDAMKLDNNVLLKQVLFGG